MKITDSQATVKPNLIIDFCNCNVIATELVIGLSSDHACEDEKPAEFLRAYCVDCGRHWFSVDSSWWVYIWLKIFGVIGND